MTQDKRKASAIARLVQSRRAMLVLVAVLVFIWLLFEIKTDDIMRDDIMRLDAAAYSLVVMHMRTAWLTPIMQSISDLAYPVVLVVMLLVIEVFAPGRRPGLCAAVNLVLATLLNLLLKTLVQRPRPEGYRLVAESGFSFPSGHSMVAMAFYGLASLSCSWGSAASTWASTTPPTCLQVSARPSRGSACTPSFLHPSSSRHVMARGMRRARRTTAPAARTKDNCKPAGGAPAARQPFTLPASPARAAG